MANRKELQVQFDSDRGSTQNFIDKIDAECKKVGGHITEEKYFDKKKVMAKKCTINDTEVKVWEDNRIDVTKGGINFTFEGEKIETRCMPNKFFCSMFITGKKFVDGKELQIRPIVHIDRLGLKDARVDYVVGSEHYKEHGAVFTAFGNNDKFSDDRFYSGLPEKVKKSIQEGV